MQKHLKDYLHLYLGCECYYDRTHYAGKLIGIEDDSAITWDTVNGRVAWPLKRMLPILRPLSDMTEEEKSLLKINVFQAISIDEPNENVMWTFAQTKWLLDNCFDIFNLIEANLARDKTTL